MYVKKVRKNTALNPVAQAVARAKLKEEITAAQIRLYTMYAGDECEELVTDIVTTLRIVGIAAELDPGIGSEDVAVRIIKGALSACQQLFNRNRWDPQQAPALDMGLNKALELVSRLKARHVNDAIHIIITQGSTTNVQHPESVAPVAKT